MFPRTLTLFVLAMFVFISSCEKDKCDDPQPGTLSKTEQLSLHTWIYDEYYTNWGTPSQSLAYKRGRAVNAINYAPNRVKFFRDGTFEETMNTGVFRSGVWQFQSNETVLATGSTSFSNTVNLIKLSADSLIWHDVINNSYAIQISKK